MSTGTGATEGRQAGMDLSDTYVPLSAISSSSFNCSSRYELNVETITSPRKISMCASFVCASLRVCACCAQIPIGTLNTYM